MVFPQSWTSMNFEVLCYYLRGFELTSQTIPCFSKKFGWILAQFVSFRLPISKHRPRSVLIFFVLCSWIVNKFELENILARMVRIMEYNISSLFMFFRSEHYQPNQQHSFSNLSTYNSYYVQEKSLPPRAFPAIAILYLRGTSGRIEILTL